MSSENVPESAPEADPESVPIEPAADQESPEPGQDPTSDDLNATVYEDTAPEVDLNVTIYHDTLEDDVEFVFPEPTPPQEEPDLNVTLPFIDATDFPVAESYAIEPVELTKSKSQQVMTSETGELIDPDEIVPELSTLVMKTELGPVEPVVEGPKVEPPFKSRRVQVPSANITQGISSIEPRPKKPPKKKMANPTPQKIGVLVGVPCRRRSSIKPNDEEVQKEKLKHFSVVFLFSRLRNPIKWKSETFEEIRAVGDAIGNDQVKTKLPIPYKDKTFYMALTSTLVKGRINSKDAPPPIFKDALLDHVSSFSGLVIKCESEYMLTWKVSDGFYLYEPCLNDSSQLLFFNGLKMMFEFILEQKKLKDRSKYYLSKISWSSLDDGHIVSLQRKWRTPKRFELKNQNVAFLMGDRYLKEASFKLESLRVSLNAIELAQDIPSRSWDASSLNGLFEGTMTDKFINKLGIFLCEQGSEAEYLLDRLRMIRLNVSFNYAQRDLLEQLVNRLLATRIALILKADESYFAVWSSEKIVYFFSPFRYDALDQDPNSQEDNACFLYAFNSLAKLSTVLFDYLAELRLLPKHSISLFSVDNEPFGPKPRLPVVDSKDSLHRSELEIRVPAEERVKRFVSDADLPPTTLSVARVCRLMLREIVGGTELKDGKEQWKPIVVEYEAKRPCDCEKYKEKKPVVEEEKKTETGKPEDTKATESGKSDDKKATEGGKSEQKPSLSKKSEEKKPEEKKSEVKKPEVKKPEVKKTDDKPNKK